MSNTLAVLPVKKTIEPASQAEAAEAVRACFDSSTPVYPVGGGTSLDYGLPAKEAGTALQLTGLNRIVDYPARDMTITLEAGVTIESLRKTLAAEHQQLPVDVPHAENATIGGVIAVNQNGPRRSGYGPLRDYVIGISAIDGTGRPFSGGGRVVKNVAGYDFCKLLTGSLGTLGVITQVTLKVRPLPERSLLVGCALQDFDQAEALLCLLNDSPWQPTAVELFSGPAWQSYETLPPGLRNTKLGLLVGLEGTAAEVEWLRDQVLHIWKQESNAEIAVAEHEPATALWNTLAEFPASESQLSLKANLTPSGVVPFCRALHELHPSASILAHAFAGEVVACLAEVSAGEISSLLGGKLRPLAAKFHGHVSVLADPQNLASTSQFYWGAEGGPLATMQAVKQKFDPRGILNPGRFVV